MNIKYDVNKKWELLSKVAGVEHVKSDCKISR
jgi:hypothetical protein